MPPVPESSAAPASAGQAVPNDYDSFAEAYTGENEASLLNAYYCGPRSWTWPGTWPGDGSWTPAAAPAP